MNTVTTLPSAAPSSTGSSARAYASLALGLIGLLTCTVLSPLAWYLGWAERRDIRAGIAPSAGDDVATIGMVLGMIGTALLGVIVLAVLAVAVVVIIVVALAH